MNKTPINKLDQRTILLVRFSQKAIIWLQKMYIMI